MSAKDKASGKEAKITIKANSGLSDEEIQQMVRDGEAHAEEDKKQRELVDARNQCDGLIHSVKKTLAEQGDKVGAEDKAAIEAAIKDAEEALKSNDKETIEAKMQVWARPRTSWPNRCRHKPRNKVRVARLELTVKG